MGKPNTARAPASTAGGAKANQRGRSGSARSASTTGRSSRWASTQGPSPRVNCSSSISALTSLLEHTEPCCVSPVMSMMPAPVMSATLAHASHRRAGSGSLLHPDDNSARMRNSRSPAMARPSVDHAEHVAPSSTWEALNEVWIQRAPGLGRSRTKPTPKTLVQCLTWGCSRPCRLRFRSTAVFVVAAPLRTLVAHPENRMDEPREELAVIPETTRPHRGQRVLLIEDDALTREVLSAALT